MRLRIRHASGTAMIETLGPESTLVQLQQAIATQLGISSHLTIQVTSGYPPKPISPQVVDLKTAGLRDGDVLTIQRVDPPKEIATPKVQKMGSTEAVAIAKGRGYVVLRIYRYVLKRDVSKAQDLRHVVAGVIDQESITYDDATLGKPREHYVEWIKKNTAWGGAIELSIFSQYYGVEIASIDIQTGRIDRFGEGNYQERVFILYTGIHYDALAMAPTMDSPMEFDQTQFSIHENDVLDAATQLAAALRQAHHYTDVANFSLKCQICQKGLVGEKDAQVHATSTGHTQFVEYK
ncbi:hypothetical protein BDF14DRAFT_1880830 [Spinellus fusiger]|nr:hypothetical protein BDF14DRAFT_1880830 [Spinellus fusiger]